MTRHGCYLIKTKTEIYGNNGSLDICILALDEISSQEESDPCDLERTPGEIISTGRISGCRMSMGSAKDGQDTNLTKSRRFAMESSTG